MDAPSLIFWALALWSIFARGPIAYYLFFASWSFGTLAVIPPALIGVSITAPWTAAAVFTLRVLRVAGLPRATASLFKNRYFLPLTLATLYGVGITLIAPSFFAGHIQIVSMRPGVHEGLTHPLGPTPSNLTQLLYFVLTASTTLATFLAWETDEGRRHLFPALRVGAMFAVGTGIIDQAASLTGASALLTPFRNATYTLLVDDAVSGGLKRTVGLMSEASAYAALCLSFLSIQIFPPLSARRVGGPPLVRFGVVGLLIVMTYFSTSSGGLLDLVFIGALAIADLVRNTFRGRRSAALGLYAVILAATIAIGLALFSPAVTDAIWRLFDGLVLQKTHSSSYHDRTLWNVVAYQAFLQSNLVGIGLGSTRASSWVYAVLSNLGIAGTVLIAVFILQVLVSGARTAANRDILFGFKVAILPGLLVQSLSGASAGYGLGNAVALGFAIAMILDRSYAERPATPAAVPTTTVNDVAETGRPIVRSTR